MEKRIRVGVVIPTIGRESLKKTLDALVGQGWDALVVIHDYQRNVSKAKNSGWWSIHRDCDLIAFTDDDCIPDKDFIEEGRKFFEENPKIDLMQGKITGGINTSEDFFFVGANFWIPVKSLKVVGGFDEKFVGAGHEDLDLGWRIEKLNGTVAYNEKCIVVHPSSPQHEDDERNNQLIAKKFPERYKKLLEQNTAR